MPNWCQNNLRVYGDTIEISEFKQATLKLVKEENLETTEFTFEGLYPTPEELLNSISPAKIEDGETEEQFSARLKRLREEYGASDWYEWRIENWGTKWDADETLILEDSVDELYLCFNTAWAPPTEWLKKVSLRFPNLNFVMDYMEEGQGYCGVLDISDGEIKEETGNTEFIDQDGRQVFYNEDDGGGWKYVETNENVDDDSDDFYPTAINPLI